MANSIKESNFYSAAQAMEEGCHAYDLSCVHLLLSIVPYLLIAPCAIQLSCGGSGVGGVGGVGPLVGTRCVFPINEGKKISAGKSASLCIPAVNTYTLPPLLN